MIRVIYVLQEREFQMRAMPIKYQERLKPITCWEEFQLIYFLEEAHTGLRSY
jgi:hypothetical protein